MDKILTPLIATYARVSTANQKEEGTIQNQMASLREFAAKNNYKIVQEYADEGWSGDSLERPELDRLRLDVKKKAWQAVLIYDPDRLARRYSYQELVADELKEAGVEVMFITTPAPKNGEDKILHGVKGLFAEYERAKIAERFRLGKLRKVKEGHVLVSEAPYGYRYIPKKDAVHGYFEIDPVEAEVVRMIFHWVAHERMTLRKVVHRLREMNIKPRKSKKGVWATSTLTTLFRNGAYIGKAHWGSTYAVVPENPYCKEKYRKTKKSSRKVRPREEWYEIAVPAIIDEKIFKQAGEQLDANFVLCKRNKKNDYLLAGRLFCVCGRRRSGEGVLRGKHLYYRCNDRVLSYPLPPNCHERGINARIADQLVWKKISALMGSKELLEREIGRWKAKRISRTGLSSDEISSTEKEVSKLKTQESRYNRAYAEGLYSLDQLKEYLAPVRDRLTQLESRLADARMANAENKDISAPTDAEIKAFSERVRQALPLLNFEQKRGIVIRVIEKIVASQRSLQVSGYVPVMTGNYALGYIPALNNHVEYNISDSHGGDTKRLKYVEYKTSDRYSRSAKRREIDAF